MSTVIVRQYASCHSAAKACQLPASAKVWHWAVREMLATGSGDTMGAATRASPFAAPDLTRVRACPRILISRLDPSDELRPNRHCARIRRLSQEQKAGSHGSSSPGSPGLGRHPDL